MNTRNTPVRSGGSQSKKLGIGEGLEGEVENRLERRLSSSSKLTPGPARVMAAELLHHLPPSHQERRHRDKQRYGIVLLLCASETHREEIAGSQWQQWPDDVDSSTGW